jgi:serine protease Do
MRKPRSSVRIGAVAAAVIATAGCRTKTDPAPVAATAIDAGAGASQPTAVVYPKAAPGSFIGLTTEVAPSVVAIRSTDRVMDGPGDAFAGIDDEYALGTGFLIDTAGYILTNDHVIADAPGVKVVLHTGEEREAIVAGRDPKLDVALLKIDMSRGLRPLPLADSDRANVGEWVLAVGDPFGLGASVSAGILSHKGKAPVGPKGEYHRAYLQTDADIHVGNSGGPLVNLGGKVIGIATAVDGRTKVGYAIPINDVKGILPQLKTDGAVSRAWLGAFVAPMTQELARHLRLESGNGAFVSGVVPNGPAQRAGIRRGDVILRFDRREVDDKSLAWIASTTGVGQRIEVEVWRDGGAKKLELISEKMPE